jgi:hypothetical protein
VEQEQHDAEKAFKKRGYEEVDRMMTDGFNAEGTVSPYSICAR